MMMRKIVRFNIIFLLTEAPVQEKKNDWTKKALIPKVVTAT